MDSIPGVRKYCRRNIAYFGKHHWLQQENTHTHATPLPFRPLGRAGSLGTRNLEEQKGKGT